MSLLSPPLEAFVAVVRRGTVQQAAQDLSLTQTGVTQRIRSLESRLGVTLFTRSRRGMRLTGEGEALLRYCRAATELEGEVLARLTGKAVEAEVEMRVTGPSSIMRSRVIPACAEVAGQFSRLIFFFDLDDEDTGANKLRSGGCDLAVVPRGEVAPEMDSKMLQAERYILVGPRAWRRRRIREIVTSERIVDFDTRDRMTLSYLKKHQLMPRSLPPRHFVNNTDALAALVAMGVGYTVLEERFAAPFLESGDLVALHPGHAYENQLALAWYPRPEMPEYFQAMIDAIS